ncbi:hypothetical protein AJ87_20285 [Rhizobium yanglingense]|nr:hypothetical protein AJ87_20285 [Rhizobium yanglingense]
MERLAEIACMSSYHWHKIYRAIYGETLAATVKRLRLHRAAARYRKEGSHKTFEPSPNGKTAAMFDINLTEEQSPRRSADRIADGYLHAARMKPIASAS